MENFAQLDQDLWVLERTQNKKGGFFVEAGAMDGIHFSTPSFSKRNFNGVESVVSPIHIIKTIENRNCETDSLVLYDKDDEEVEFFLAGSLGGTEEDLLLREPDTRIERSRKNSPKNNISKLTSRKTSGTKYN